MKNLTYITAFIVLIFTSCRPKPLDIHVEAAPPKLVVFSHVIPNQFMVLSLTRSFSALNEYTEDDYANLLVAGATVKVTNNGTTYDFYDAGNGIYISYTANPNFNTNYTLDVYEGKDTISATTIMQQKVEFDEVLPSIIETEEDTTVQLQMKFTDIPGDNYYLINVYRKNSNTGNNPDNVNFFANGSNALAASLVYSDKEFNTNFDRTFTFDSLTPEDSIVTTLTNISEEYYGYLNQKLNNGSIFVELNLEPFNYPTNVVNGYGFFTAHFPSIRFFDLGEY